MSWPRASGAVAVLAGVGLLAAHAIVAPALVAWTARPPLRVRTEGPRVVEDPAAAASAGRTLGGVRAREDDDGAAPGLVRHRWITRYRGGIERTVGRVRLIGPLQDVAAPPCGGRLAVGQRLLDDGRAGPGTVAAVLARELSAALADVDVVAAGEFRRLKRLEVRWATLVAHPYEIGLFPAAALAAPLPTGYLRASAIAEFRFLDVPIVVGALPRIDGGQLGFTVGVRARLDFGNRVLDWINDKVGGDAIVTRMANGEVDRSLLAALGPPPPLALPGGRTLTVELCPGRAVEIVDGASAAVPVRWRLGGPSRAGDDERVRPAAHPSVAWPAPDPATPITLDLDPDGLDGLAYELWRTGYLDELLDGLELPRRFNEHPLVRDLLSLRLSPMRLALPPTIAAGAGDRLRLALALAVNVADGELVTPATAWGVLDVGLGARASATASPTAIATDVAVAGLDLTCEPEPGLLAPCYPDLVASVRDATGDVHAAMSDALGGALTALFVDRRLTAAGAPAALAIHGARARGLPVGGQAVVRVELDARVDAPPP
jgi:hypothetical protein